eukprot:6309693-Amphidinium_carterae.1
MSFTRAVSPLALTGDFNASNRRSTACKRRTTYLSSEAYNRAMRLEKAENKMAGAGWQINRAS